MNLFTRIASLPVRLKLGLSLLIGALLVIVLAVFTVSQYTQLSQPVADSLAQVLATERAHLIDSIVNSTIGVTNHLATDQTMGSAYGMFGGNTGDNMGQQGLEEEYRNFLSDFPSLRRIRFVSLTGKVLVSVPSTLQANDQNEDYFKALQNSKSPTNIYVGSLHKLPVPSLDFVGQPMVGGKSVGYLVVTLDPSSRADPTQPSIFETLNTVTFRGTPFSLYLVDSDGNLVTSSAIPAVKTSQTLASAQILAVQPFTQPRQYTSALTGQTALGFTVRIEGLNATLVAESPVIPIVGSSDLGQVFIQLIFVVLGCIAVLVLVGYVVDRTTTLPLMQLTSIATRFVQSRSVTEVRPIRQNDEVGQLYRSLNTLIGQLNQNIKDLELRIADRTRDIEATREIGEVVSSIRDLDTLLNKVLELIRQRFEQIYHVQVFLIDPTRRFAILRAATGEAGARLLARNHRLAVGSQSVIGRVTIEGKPVVALDTSTSTIHRANELLPETRAELALPLRSGEIIIGALDLQSKRVEAFSDADVQLFQHVADQLAIAITNAQLFTESQSRLAEIGALNQQLLGEAWGNYRSNRRLTLTASSAVQHGNQQSQATTEPESDLQHRAIETRELVEEIGVNAVTFAVPIILRDIVLGAIEWDVSRETYNENTRLLARELADRLAITADNARLFEQSQRQAERERLVNEISAKLTQQTDVSQILQTAIRELGQALHVPETSIRLAKHQDQ